MYVCELFVTRDGNRAMIHGGLSYLAGRPNGVNVVSGDAIDPDAKTGDVKITNYGQSLKATDRGIEIRNSSQEEDLVLTVPWEHLWDWIRPTQEPGVKPGTLVFPLHIPGSVESEGNVFSPDSVSA